MISLEMVEKTVKTSPSDHRTSEKAKNGVVETMVIHASRIRLKFKQNS